MHQAGQQEAQAAQHIEFEAAVARVQTMADGGLRVVLDLPEDKVFEVAWLMECKRQQATIRVSCEPGTDKQDDGNPRKHSKIHI